MNAAGVDSLQQKGWVRLPFQFSADAFLSLAGLNPHFGCGQRLTNMSALATRLPLEFKRTLSNFGFDPMPLRAVGFHKSSEGNWSLPWHQDRIVAMEEKMAFAYVAFDEICEGQGGLELAEKTHQFGVISEGKIKAHFQTAKIARPNMQTGEVFLVSALTLHRSAPMKTHGARKTLRIDFANHALNLSN